MSEAEKHLYGLAEKKLPGLAKNKTDNTQDEIILILSGLLVFAAAETLRVAFRERSDQRPIKLYRLLTYFFACLGIAAITIFQNDTNSGNISSAFVLVLFSIFILIKGHNHQKRKNNIEQQPTALSIRDQKIMECIISPLLMIALGFFMGFKFTDAEVKFNWFLFLPCTYCGVSVWVELLLNAKFDKPSLEQRVQEPYMRLNIPDEFNEVS